MRPGFRFLPANPAGAGMHNPLLEANNMFGENLQ
jgi:hypothetical protein